MSNIKNTSIVLLTAATLLVSCVTGRQLKTEYIKAPVEITGTFNLILYGAHHADDIETVAILDAEGDGYEIVPFAPEDYYTVDKGLPADEAINKAKRFVSFHQHFWTYDIRRIFDEKGGIIGYEIRPLYTYLGDALSINYYTEDGKRVKVVIQPIPDFKSLFTPDREMEK